MTATSEYEYKYRGCAYPYSTLLTPNINEAIQVDLRAAVLSTHAERRQMRKILAVTENIPDIPFSQAPCAYCTVHY
jgi:hypothetical protein